MNRNHSREVTSSKQRHVIKNDDCNGKFDSKDNLVEKTHSNLHGDYLNISLLLLLYILQGIPIGLISSIPFLLVNRGISYSQQAIFSFAIWPFSCKLLWAPIVDSLYWNRMGKRKSWMVPAQYLIGIFLIFISYHIDSLMNKNPNIYLLTSLFFGLNFLAATQDIAVDGWALTMLKPENVGYASTCNSVGQTTGYFFGYVLFLILESPQFANYFRSNPQPNGFVTLYGYFFFWGIVFMVVTTLVMIFKSEKQSVLEHDVISIKDSYGKLIQILRLRPVQIFAAVLLTCKIGFAVTDAATGLKLKEAGLPMDHIALLALPLLPLQIILPWIISRYTNGPKPLDVFLRAYPYRLLFCFIFAGFLWWTKFLQNKFGYFPSYYYGVLIILYAIHQVTVYSMYVAIMAFHAKISDPKFGGTYMTLLNTITNLGGNWPATLALWLMDSVTLSYCSLDNKTQCSTKNINLNGTDPCSSINAGQCTMWLDGYYIETVCFTVIGLFWYFWGRKQINYLQTFSLRVWRCRS